MVKATRVFVATETAAPRSRLSAALAAATAGLSVAVLQAVLHWQGDRQEFLLLVAFNALLASLAAWFFEVRWRLLGDIFDRRVQGIFLPIACHFLLVIVLEVFVAAPDVREVATTFSWVLTQTLAAAALLFTLQRGRALAAGARLIRPVAAIVLAVAVWSVFHVLQQHGQLRGVAPIEAALAAIFLVASLTPMLGGREQRQPREVWLGAAFLLTSAAHLDLAWSQAPYDSPFMWGFVLVALSLATPTIGAVLENVTLLESQMALSDHLKGLRNRMEILLETLPVLVLSVDRDRGVRYANHAARTLFPTNAEAAAGADVEWLERIHEHHRSEVFAAIPAVLDGEQESWEQVVRVEGDDGTVHWLNFLMHPVVDPVADETLIQVVATDVTDLHVARRAAEARQSRLAFLSAVAQTVAGEVEEQRILDRFLALGRELLPLRSILLYRATGEGLHLVAGTGPGLEAFERDRFHAIRAGDHPCWITFSETIPQTTVTATVVGDELAEWLSTDHGITQLNYLPLTAAGRSAGVLLATSAVPLDLMVDDVDLLTQIGFLIGGAISLSQLVRELDEQRAVAFEASRLKSEFLANTSHELRTPLTAILGFLRLIIDGAVADPAKQREFLQIAHESAENLLNLINDVLDLAKIEAGRLEVHFAPVPVRALLEETQSLFKHQLKSKGLKLQLESPDGRLVLWADPDRTSQVLTNLLSNALKFTDRGGAITLRCRRCQDGIALEVQDTGIGLDRDELQKIFDSFYQVDGSTTRQRGGTGLGLTISRRLAELMGGSLEIESKGAGCGTTARLVLEEFRADHSEGAQSVRQAVAPD